MYRSHGMAAQVSGPPVLFEPIADRDAAGETNLDVFWTGDYEAVFLELSDVVPVVGAAGFLLRTSGDGSTFDAGASDYQYRFSGWSSGTNSSLGPGSFVPIGSANGVGNTAINGVRWSLIIPSPSVAATRKQIIGHGSRDITGLTLTSQIYASRDAAGIVNGVRFYWGSGSFTSGRLVASGLRRA